MPVITSVLVTPEPAAFTSCTVPELSGKVMVRGAVADDASVVLFTVKFVKLPVPEVSWTKVPVPANKL